MRMKKLLFMTLFALLVELQTKKLLFGTCGSRSQLIHRQTDTDRQRHTHIYIYIYIYSQMSAIYGHVSCVVWNAGPV